MGNGFQAFLTFAPVCQSLRLYGFGGTGQSIDFGHALGSWHNYTAEHEIIDKVAAGTILDSEFEKVENGQNRRSDWIRLQLADLVRNRELSITGASAPSHEPSEADVAAATMWMPMRLICNWHFTCSICFQTPWGLYYVVKAVSSL